MRIISISFLLLLTGSFISMTPLTVALPRSTELQTIKSKRFSFQLPVWMYQMTDLNTQATEQYGYIGPQDNGDPLEFYMIVIEETHKEIKGYNLGFEFDALSYSESAVKSIESGLDDYRVITAEPKVEQINGMDCVYTAMKGKLGAVEVYYNLGVFHGEKAFYQVLTWTLMDQRNEFSENMEAIIRSFDEK